MIVKLHDGTEGELVGRVRVIGLTFSPEIVLLAGEGERILWHGDGFWDVRVARIALTEAVALAGLCFWPPSYTNDKRRALDLSPWVRDLIAKAYHEGFTVGVTPILDIPKIETQPGAATIFGRGSRR